MMEFNQYGSFLIRDSETTPGDYSLSIRDKERVRHYRRVGNRSSSDQTQRETWSWAIWRGVGGIVEWNHASRRKDTQPGTMSVAEFLQEAALMKKTLVIPNCSNSMLSVFKRNQFT